MTIPRPEYPRPQFVRSDWLCLNGEWQFEIDAGEESGDSMRAITGDLNSAGRDISKSERWPDARTLSPDIQRELKDRIIVPFCPESTLSGVGNVDFMDAVWYRREVSIPKEWVGHRVLLHFQAVDYDATVWVNGLEVGRHRGGFTPFTCDISEALSGDSIQAFEHARRSGVQLAHESAESPDARILSPQRQVVTIVVRARDSRNGPQPRGKQSTQLANAGCLYTRTTGIWQTVWMEPVPESHLLRPRITPDVTNSLFRLEQPIAGPRHGLTLDVTLRDFDGVVCKAQCRADGDFTPRVDLPIPTNRRRLWAPGEPNLYDIDLALKNETGAAIDTATTYAGLRNIAIDGPAILINGKRVFQRLVLDQGYYPDGIMTAPSDDALRRDIELSLAAGFNGARLHQKVFEERFLYHADRLGYIVWGEFPDWGCGGFGPDDDHQQPTIAYAAQWLEALQRDYSHPSIVGWCALNETWQEISDRITTLDDATRALFLAAKAMDTTRPVLDASGYSHRIPESDVYDCHDYEQEPGKFAQRYSARNAECGTRNAECIGPYVDSGARPWSLPYRGQPYFLSEFGGIWWNPDAKPGEDSWGYDNRPKSIEEFYDRFEKLCAVLLDNPAYFGYCYTQLTDVFQEQNGIYKFDRSAKFDMERIRRAQRCET